MKKIIEVRNIDDNVIWNINKDISFVSFMNKIAKENGDEFHIFRNEQDALNYFNEYCELFATYIS